MDTTPASALSRLVDDGVLTADQAAAVADALSTAAPPRRGLSAVAEALAYAGAAIAGSAALALGAVWWDRILPPGQVGVLVLAALALLAAGWWVDGEDAAGPVRRLVAFCWFLAIAAAASAVAVATESWPLLPDAGALLAVGGATAALAAVLLRRRPSALLVVPLFLGAQATTFGLLDLVVAPERWSLGGLLFWSVSAGFALLAWTGVVRPLRPAIVLACAGALIGAQVLRFDADGPGLALGLGTAVALLAAMRLGERTVAALGAAGLVVFVPQALAVAFPGAVGAPVALFTIGLAVLGVALAQVRQQRGAA
jgi:hypothetical protein